ncbi:transcriptional regulator with XRE-family HTH domain [Microbacterium halimionae]|uniref:Transcriptional regulator with XRE-family HTH domain n=1 Tax=Microbacterium halimionae TaxID=1526413 RepID=A0A7W3PMT7_9MICO|nr:XRE family transcriptional regulator [Microbacterium halimionae]MBA8817302.1 transcriptional regulator with XRE-family HTH domain [Microbacterium halimionae]NII95936.1 transcriptional regulator with XRE-family HTH domain [Microbacterium halimionae]
MNNLGQRIARALKREREAAGLSVSELARRSGVSKATVSQLESSGGNPNVETLWALATALGLPFAALVDERSPAPTLVRSTTSSGIRSSQAMYTATLLAPGPPQTRRDLYLINAEPGSARRSEPHPRGTTEHLVLISGEARVGPTDAPFILAPGDYLSYPGDEPHIFEALSAGTSAVLISEMR